MRAKLKVFICVYKFCGYKKRAVRPFGVCTDFVCAPPKINYSGLIGLKTSYPAFEMMNIVLCL